MSSKFMYSMSDPIINDMGTRSTGRIYLHCTSCREVRDKASSKRKEKMEARAQEQ